MNKESQPVVQVSDLIVKYGERTVLNSINSRIYPAEIRVILGTSGCGKTTLLKSIIGLLKRTSGCVRIFDTVINDQDEPETVEVLKKVGVLFQNGALLGSLTVLENVALPLQMHTDLSDKLITEIVRMKLEQVDLPNAASLYPGELSGGMRKRAALARALVLDPPLLFCDEPSAGLDPVTSAGLDALLLKLRTILGITITVVTHELESINKIADTITFLHNGTLLYEGPYKDALKIESGPIPNFFKRHEPNQKESRSRMPKFNLETI